MEFKIYQDREKIKETGNNNEDYRILFPQTVEEAVVVKNDFANDNTLKSVLEYLIENKTNVVVSRDEPTNTVGSTCWMKIIGTYNNGAIGNIFSYYILNHILRNHDGTTVTKATENVICESGKEIPIKTNKYDGYLAEPSFEITVTESGQSFDRYYDEQQYNITYVLNGGTNSENNLTSIYYTEEFTLENATKDGYTFDGWYSEIEFVNKINVLSNVSNDIVLYAKFNENKPPYTELVTDIQPVNNDEFIYIQFTKPANASEVRLVYNEDHIPKNETDGEYKTKYITGKNNITYFVQRVECNKKYYYALFPMNSDNVYNCNSSQTFEFTTTPIYPEAPILLANLDGQNIIMNFVVPTINKYDKFPGAEATMWDNRIPTDIILCIRKDNSPELIEPSETGLHEYVTDYEYRVINDLEIYNNNNGAIAYYINGSRDETRYYSGNTVSINTKDWNITLEQGSTYYVQLYSETFMNRVSYLDDNLKSLTIN